MDKMKTYVIITLLSLLILGFIFFSIKQDILKKENLRLLNESTKKKENYVKSLEKGLENSILKLDSINNSIEEIKKVNKEKKSNLKKYEKIPYYDDVDSDRADSIISNCSYRYSK